MLGGWVGAGVDGVSMCGGVVGDACYGGVQGRSPACVEEVGFEERGEGVGVDDAGARTPEGAGAGLDGGREGRGVAGGEEFGGDGQGGGVGVEVLEGGVFVGGLGDDQLAGALVGDGVRGAEGVEELGATEAEARFEGVLGVVEPGMDYLAGQTSDIFVEKALRKCMLKGVLICGWQALNV